LSGLIPGAKQTATDKPLKRTAHFTTEMNSQSRQNPLILASSSIYRQVLLKRLGLSFSSQSPNIPELRLRGEAALDMVLRLAQAKARGISDAHPSAMVIGSDQAGECDGAIIGKPANEAEAVAQLLRFSGKSVTFLTAVAVHCAALDFSRVAQVPTVVKFRRLDVEEARRYVTLDYPLDCAGSFKSECAGPMLFESVNSTDPTALIGLPLISLSGMLRDAGFHLP